VMPVRNLFTRTVFQASDIESPIFMYQM
jgi:hypothetical protein